MTETSGPPTPRRRHRNSFPIARVAGIEVRVHFTFFLLLALFAYAGPAAGFDNAFMAVAWVLAVFGCVLVHEFSHCIVARRRGGEVHEILLMPLGGISKLERLPERPADEFAIAIAGPIASFGIAIAAGLACIATGRALVPIDLVAGAWFARLAWLNLILGAFNLLPAFPLDGGRVFRSLLERRLDLESATIIATRVGHAFAAALVVVGILFDIWLALIGLFVYFGASAEQTATIVHLRLRGHRVGELMRIDLDRLAPFAGLASNGVAPNDQLSDEIVARVASAPDRQLPVVKSGQLVGVLRFEDIERLVASAPAPIQDAPKPADNH